ncbi:MAG: hypothetical protein ACE5MI_14135 [Acidimicrobiia bacterium]
MRVSRWAQLAPLTGVGFVVLFVAGTLLINHYEFQPPPEEIKSFLEEGSDRVVWGSYLGLLSAAFLLWFSGSVRSSLRVAEGGTGRVSAVAFGGGVAAAVLIAVVYSALPAAADRAGSSGGIAVETATGLLDLSQWLFGAVAIGLAVLVGATAVVSFRTDRFPVWLVWASAVVAVGMLSPVSFIFVGLAIPWVLVVSIMLYVSGRAEARMEPA